MAKDKLLRGCRLYHGGYDLSCDSRTFGTLENTCGEIDNWGWCETHGNYLADRRMVGIMGYQAMMNDTAGRSLPVLSAQGTAAMSMLIGDAGAVPAVGDLAYLLPAIELGEIASIDGGLVMLSGDFRYDAAQYSAYYENPWGVVLHPATSLSSTTNGTSVDNVASSANGGFGIVHVTASDGGEWEFKIQDSANDADWSDLITFTIIGDAVEAEGLGVTGTVDQYVRAVATRTSGTVTPIITFARN